MDKKDLLQQIIDKNPLLKIEWKSLDDNRGGSTSLTFYNSENLIIRLRKDSITETQKEREDILVDDMILIAFSQIAPHPAFKNITENTPIN